MTDLGSLNPDDSSLVAQLLRHEGLRLKPYRDSRGRLTIGIGRNLDAVGVSRAEALLLLRNDLLHAKSGLDTGFPWWRALDPVRRRVLVDMAFNLGAAGLAEFSRMLAALQAGRFDTAAEEMLASDWAGEVGPRATELARMMRTGSDPPTAEAAVPLTFSSTQDASRRPFLLDQATMNQTKPALASTGVWGSLLAIAGALAPLVLAKVGVTDSAAQTAIIATASQTAAALGGVIALVGRLRATQRIG